MARSLVRKPSIKKSVSARTKGKITRSIKKSVNPLYGKKGIGLVNDPKKAMYNKIYNNTSIGVNDILSNNNNNNYNNDYTNTNTSNSTGSTIKAIFALISIIFCIIIWGMLFFEIIFG